MSTTPDMNLTLPDVNITPGPTYASEINTALGVIDSHDHTPGFGAKVPTAGLNINSDLPFGGFNATGLLAAAFNSQSADPSGNTRVYFKNGEMYCTDGSGNHVQLTLSGNVNVGSVGSISGMGGTSASVSFSNATKVFTFNQAANQTALLKVGDIALTDSTVTTGSAVTLKVPAGLASGYSLTTPGALPGATSILTTTAAGQLAFSNIGDGSTIVQTAGVLSVPSSGIGTSQIAATSVTRAKLAALGQQISSSSGSYTSTSSTYAGGNVTNLTVTLTHSGRPLWVGLIPDGVGKASVGVSGSSPVEGAIALSLDGINAVQEQDISCTTGTAMTIPAGSVNFIYIPGGGGSTTFFICVKRVSIGTTVSVSNCKLVAYEL